MENLSLKRFIKMYNSLFDSMDEQSCVKVLQKNVTKHGMRGKPIEYTINTSYEETWEKYPECKDILLNWKHCMYPMKKKKDQIYYPRYK